MEWSVVKYLDCSFSSRIISKILTKFFRDTAGFHIL